jgi:hypothetical protein
VSESVRGGLVSGNRGKELAKGEGREERREGTGREERRGERVVLMMIKIIS